MWVDEYLSRRVDEASVADVRPPLLALQPYSRSVQEQCVSFVEGARCSNPVLPLTRHCLSRILLLRPLTHTYTLDMLHSRHLPHSQIWRYWTVHDSTSNTFSDRHHVWSWYSRLPYLWYWFHTLKLTLIIADMESGSSCYCAFSPLSYHGLCPRCVIV